VLTLRRVAFFWIDYSLRIFMNGPFHNEQSTSSGSSRAASCQSWMQLGGPSRATMKVYHCSQTTWNLCRLARVSEVMPVALSSTDSFPLRCAPASAAAGCACPPYVSRRSSVSLHKGDSVISAAPPANLALPNRHRLLSPDSSVRSSRENWFPVGLPLSDSPA